VSRVPPPAQLGLLPGDVEEALRATVRSLLAARCTPAQVLAVYDGDDSVRAPLWGALARELGLAGLLVPEEHGGAGASAREAGVVLEELGRAVAPVPFLTSAVVATAAVLPSGDAGLLSGLAAGATTAGLLVSLTAGAGNVVASVTSDGGSLTGRVPSVAGAVEADVLVVPVVPPGQGDGIELRLVDVGADGVRIAPVVSLDMTRQVADVELSGAPSRLLLDAPHGHDAVVRALRLGAALLASEQVGIADRCLADTVEHLRRRRQFGRALGSYQALKHRLADLYVEVESARAAAAYAAAAAAAEEDVEVATAVAKIYCSDVAVHAAEERVQLHGGIGMTWEDPAHLYLKRAKADQLAFGTPGRLLTHLGDLVGLPG
jgi:alkylation response protein AidB-like acyl-CoA dehydrogenase